MSIDPRITAFRNTPNKSLRQNVPRKGVCLHHGALTSFDYLRQLAMGAKQVSATNIIKDLLNEQMMTDEFRAWSLSSAWGDSSFRTVETCNESTSGWTISDASHWTLARMVAYWAQRDGFWPHRDGDKRTWTVLGHREVYEIYGESYATACPGGMDLNLVTSRAQEILRTAGVAGLGGTPIEEDDDMKVVARTTTDPQVWIGDGVSRRRVVTQSTLSTIQWLATNGLLKVFQNGAVQKIDDLWSLGHPID